MDASQGQASVGLEHALKVIRRRAWIIVLCFLLATGAALALSEVQTKKYTATASLQFKNASVAQQASGVQAVNNNDPQGQRDTNLRLVQLADVIAQRTAAAVHGGMTAKQVKHAVSASAQGQSDVVSIAATWTDPVLAARIANEFANAFIRQQQQSDQAVVQSGITLVGQQYAQLSLTQRATAQGQSLLDRIESLKVLKAMQANTQLVQAASVPGSPSSPKVVRNTVLAAIMGLLLGFGFGFLRERLDRRLREPGDIEEALGLPMLGLVPHGAKDAARGAANVSTAVELEPFRMLRAHLRYFNVDRELRTLLVTSADPAEGKTTVARSLAAAAATMGTRTLLIEADLRRPVLASTLGLEPGIGLAGSLVSLGPIEAAVQSVDVSGAANSSVADRRLDVILAGAVPPNPAELLESHAMHGVLSWAAEQYELVVVDTAPLAVVPDTIPLMNHVDGVIVVSRLGRSTRTGAQRLRERLGSLRAPVLGVVVNDVRSRSAAYGYGYGTGYWTAPAEAAAAAEAKAEIERVADSEAETEAQSGTHA